MHRFETKGSLVSGHYTPAQDESAQDNLTSTPWSPCKIEAKALLGISYYTHTGSMDENGKRGLRRLKLCWLD